MTSLPIKRFLSQFITRSWVNSFYSVRFSSTQTKQSLFASSNAVNQITYKLPDKCKNTEIIGDKNLRKSPILDSKKTNFAIFSPVSNSAVVFYNPFDFSEVDLSISTIMNGIMNENNSNKNYELPTTKDNITKEKLAGYFIRKSPRRFTNMLWVRHRKMKKHQRKKWRRNNLSIIKRRSLERNIKKEKLFRAELLAKIREAENFDPKAYVENILKTIDNVPKPETKQQKAEHFQDLIRKNRTQTNLVKPKLID